MCVISLATLCDLITASCPPTLAQADPRERARMHMKAVSSDRSFHTPDARLQEVRRRLHDEYPCLTNLTRFIQRAVKSQPAATKQTATTKRRGPVPFSKIALPAELHACCQAVKPRHLQGGRWYATAWTPGAVSQVPQCAAVMDKYGLRDARTLMQAMLAHDKSLCVKVLRGKPKFTARERELRVAAAIQRSEACAVSKRYHTQMFMIDEAHTYKDTLLMPAHFKVATKKGHGRHRFYVEPRVHAGSQGNKRVFSRLVAVSPVTGPLALVWLAPTNGPAPFIRPRKQVSKGKIHPLRHSFLLLA